MQKKDVICCRPHISKITYERTLRYLKVGLFLHITSFFEITLLFILLGYNSKICITDFNLKCGFLLIMLLILIVAIVFAQLDAYSRYQNYKQIKDKLFLYGYDKRLVEPFSFSKCQRDAVLVAARDLGLHTIIKLYFFHQGYRWYHIFPEACTKNPIVVFNKTFWQRILFTKRHILKNFYW